jgi:hypothetical protein
MQLLLTSVNSTFIFLPINFISSKSRIKLSKSKVLKLKHLNHSKSYLLLMRRK